MKVLYGSPLPPGLDAPTRGELRIRIEKLLLKDGLVSTGVVSEVSSASPRPYTIPIDHCVVGPLFHGEQHPTCYCVPATPGKPRGVVSLVYPVKTHEPQFKDYLAHMSNSSHGGVQFLVFVPTSYTGRHRPVPVGKSIVSLDGLKRSSSISGWFAVMGDRTTITGDQEVDKSPSSAALMEVGKIKLTFTVNYFSRAPPSPTRDAIRAVTVSPYHSTTLIDGKTPSHGVEQEINKESSSVQNLLTARPALLGITNPPQDEEHPHYVYNGEDVRETQTTGATVPVQTTDVFVTPISPTEMSQRAVIGQLLQRGFSLREKMAQALSSSTAIEGLSSPSNLISTRPTPSSPGNVPNYIVHPYGAEHLHGALPFLKSPLESSFSSSSEESTDSSSDENNDCDGIGLAKNEETHDAQGSVLPSGSRPFQMFFHPRGVAIHEDACVEVDLWRIAFSSGRATLDMKEMRIGIRTSKDVKTDEPVESYSSYVHRVPLVRGADHHIIIGFPVRSFNEDKSRMVISFYKVLSEPVSNPPGELLLPVPASAKRVLLEETLLGMCIVGLHTQSRDVVLHNPITGEDPIQAHLCVTIRSGQRTHERGKNECDGGIAGDEETQAKRPSDHENLVSLKNDVPGSHCRKSAGKKQRGRKWHVQLQGSSSSLSSSSSSSNDNVLKEMKRGGRDALVKGHVACAFSSSCDGGERNPTTAGTLTTPLVDDDGGSGNNTNKYIVRDSVSHDSCTADDALKSDGCASGNRNRHAVNAKATSSSRVCQLQSGTAEEKRVRIHVSIRTGKELPMVAVNHGDPLVLPGATPIGKLHAGARSAITTDGRVVLIDSENRIFQPPTTFFVIEDIFSAVDSRSSSRGAVPDWFVEAAVRGEYDRSLVVPQSQSPQYDYECILSLPWEAVYLRQADEDARDVSPNTPRLLPHNDGPPKRPTTSLCLQDMRLTLWHVVSDTDVEKSPDLKNDEEIFWSKTAILGECKVDLCSLRFLKVLDGWYRINAIDRVDDVLGYVRVSVRLL